MQNGVGIHFHDLPGGRILETHPQRPVPVASAGIPRHPWQALVTKRESAAIKVKVWQRSTLLKTLSWTDKATITGFDSEFALTAANHLRLTVNFDTYGIFTSATLALSSSAIANPWNATHPSNPDDHEGSWVQIIAKLVAAETGEPKAGTISGTDYALWCPTTTHLLADWFCESGKEHPALLPWFGAV